MVVFGTPKGMWVAGFNVRCVGDVSYLFDNFNCERAPVFPGPLYLHISELSGHSVPSKCEGEIVCRWDFSYFSNSAQGLGAAGAGVMMCVCVLVITLWFTFSCLDVVCYEPAGDP